MLCAFSLPSRATILYFVYISYICLLDLFFFHNQCIIPNMFQPHAQLFLDFAKIEDHSGSLEVKSHNETSRSPILLITIYQYGRHMPIPKRASIFYTWLRIATSFPTTPSITHLMIEWKPFLGESWDFWRFLPRRLYVGSFSFPGGNFYYFQHCLMDCTRIWCQLYLFRNFYKLTPFELERSS